VTLILYFLLTFVILTLEPSAQSTQISRRENHQEWLQTLEIGGLEMRVKMKGEYREGTRDYKRLEHTYIG
jgi:hypothetical protein